MNWVHSNKKLDHFSDINRPASPISGWNATRLNGKLWTNQPSEKKCYLILSLHVLFFPFFFSVVSYEPVGCFRDRKGEHRPLPMLVKNYRWPARIDWNNLNKTIAACAKEVKDKGFWYFSLQFYGECWSGPQAHQTYYEDGESRRCKLGVGMARANFVYRLVPKGNFLTNSIALPKIRVW